MDYKRVKRSIETQAMKFKRFFLFGLVGGSGTVINTGILWLLTQFAGFHYIIASVIATEVAIITNFLGNNFLTFRDSANGNSLWKKFLSFQGISMVTIIGTVTILWALTTLFGEALLLVWNLIAIVIMFVANFILNKKITWGTKQKSASYALFMFAVVTILSTALAAPSVTAAGEDVVILETWTDLVDDDGYTIAEGTTANFRVTMNDTTTVDWFIDDILINSTENATSGFAWTPPLLFTNGNRTATIDAATPAGNRSWNVVVTNLMETWFEDRYGHEIAVLHIRAINSTDYYRVEAVIANADSLKVLELVNSSEIDGKIDWALDFTAAIGDNKLTRINVYGNESRSYEVSRIIHHRDPPSKDDDARINRRGGGGGGGGAFLLSGPPELIYLTFENDVLQTNETQDVRLDAKAVGGEIIDVAVMIDGPDGKLREQLELVSGSAGYGTWAILMEGLEPGTYHIEQVFICDDKEECSTAYITNRTFSVTGETGPIEPFAVIYSTLDNHMVKLNTTVTFRTDVRDPTGIVAANATVISNRDSEQTIALELVDGDEFYGAWEGTFLAEQPDATYRVTEVMLTNGTTEELVLILDRSVYVELPPKGENLLTGETITEPIEIDFKALAKKPLLPTGLAFAIICIIMISLGLVTRIKAWPG